MDIPRDKNYPSSAIQCDECGGHGGDDVCDNRGWLPAGHARGRRCHRDACNNPIPPAQVAVYCSDNCALLDAYGGRPVAGDEYLVWSNEHMGWWKSGPLGGYTVGLLLAGRYTREQALRICRDALGTAMHMRVISEIPVRFADVSEFLGGQVIPTSILHGGR